MRAMPTSAARVALYAVLLVALEWLFFTTKPSLFSTVSTAARLASLVAASLPFALGALLVHGALLALGWAVSRFPGRGAEAASKILGGLVPGVLLAVITLLLVDNFSYTMFGWGIVSTKGAGVVLYLLGWLAAVAWFVRSSIRARPLLTPRGATWALGVWLALSGLGAGWLLQTQRVDASSLTSLTERSGRDLPNIIVFSADALIAERMSAYGYRRKTTPNLDKYLDRALVFENAFTNSGKTTGSVTALSTGRYPSTTKVAFPPYTLEGADAYRNFPRLLRQLGYRNNQETIRYYADGEDLNWKEAFDTANGREIPPEIIPASAASVALDLPISFGRQVADRIFDRLKHLHFIESMSNPFELVTNPEHPRVERFKDTDRTGRLHEFIKQGHRPFYAHIHLLKTHCCKYRPEKKVFSKKSTGNKRRDNERAYDDVILEVDGHFGKLMKLLEEEKILDNTIVVFTSDHGKRYGFKDRIPLIFFFPEGEHAGRVTSPVQVIDVAPTFLDYMGLAIPPWMEGASLVREVPPMERPIYAMSEVYFERRETDKGQRLGRVVDMGPPTYGWKEFGMVYCHRWYTLGIRDGKVASGDVKGFKEPCPNERLPSKETAKEMMVRHLRERGFGI